MSFSDEPSYLTAAGRGLIGSAAGAGSISVADMTAMTGDLISAFVAPALGVANARTMGQVLDGRTAIRSERQIASKDGPSADL